MSYTLYQDSSVSLFKSSQFDIEITLLNCVVLPSALSTFDLLTFSFLCSFEWSHLFDALDNQLPTSPWDLFLTQNVCHFEVKYLTGDSITVLDRQSGPALTFQSISAYSTVPTPCGSCNSSRQHIVIPLTLFLVGDICYAATFFSLAAFCLCLTHPCCSFLIHAIFSQLWQLFPASLSH